MARTKSIPQRPFLHPEYSGKTIVDPTQRPTFSNKTPAYLFTHIPGPHYGGKTYIPRPEPTKKKRNRVIYTAPPMKGSAPVERGAKVLHEIYHFQQKHFEPLLPYQPFKRLVREILQDVLYDIFRDSMETTRISPNAILALRVAAEDHVVHMMKISTLFAHHGKRITVQPRDIQLYKTVIRLGLPHRL